MQVSCCFEHGCEAKGDAKDGAQVNGQKMKFLLSNDLLLTNIPKDSDIQRKCLEKAGFLPPLRPHPEQRPVPEVQTSQRPGLRGEVLSSHEASSLSPGTLSVP